MACLAKVISLLNKKRKLGPKTINCVFVAYSLNSTTHIKVLHSETIEISNKIQLLSHEMELFLKIFSYEK